MITRLPSVTRNIRLKDLVTDCQRTYKRTVTPLSYISSNIYRCLTLLYMLIISLGLSLYSLRYLCENDMYMLRVIYVVMRSMLKFSWLEHCSGCSLLQKAFTMSDHPNDRNTKSSLLVNLSSHERELDTFGCWLYSKSPDMQTQSAESSKPHIFSRTCILVLLPHLLIKISIAIIVRCSCWCKHLVFQTASCSVNRFCVIGYWCYRC